MNNCVRGETWKVKRIWGEWNTTAVAQRTASLSTWSKAVIVRTCNSPRFLEVEREVIRLMQGHHPPSHPIARVRWQSNVQSADEDDGALMMGLWCIDAHPPDSGEETDPREDVDDQLRTPNNCWINGDIFSTGLGGEMGQVKAMFGRAICKWVWPGFRDSRADDHGHWRICGVND